MRREPPEAESRITKLPVELRATGRSPRRIGGLAAVFGVISRPLGGFVEQIDSHAFNKSEGDGWVDVACRFNHLDEMLLGTTSSGTLRLAIESKGLHYTVDLPECRDDVLELVERRDVSRSSFAFQTYEDQWDHQNGATLRTLLSVRLLDVAPVVNPAYPQTTSAALRSLARHVGAPYEDVVERAHEDELRGFFVRTDVAPPGRAASRAVSPAQAKLILMEKRYPGGRPDVGKDGRLALTQTMGKRWPDETVNPASHGRAV